MSNQRFIHDPENDWGRIRDTKLGKNISVFGYVPDQVAKQCRIDGTDPHQERVDEILALLNASPE